MSSPCHVQIPRAEITIEFNMMANIRRALTMLAQRSSWMSELEPRVTVCVKCKLKRGKKLGLDRGSAVVLVIGIEDCLLI